MKCLLVRFPRARCCGSSRASTDVFLILRSFSALLRKAMEEEEMPMGHYQSESRYSLHIHLLDIEPPIWRTIVVPGAISLHTLHKMLQVVMGWENAHLYWFRLQVYHKPMIYGLPDPDWDGAAIRVKDSRRTKLDATVWAESLELIYEYDLGDSWMHQIRIERIDHLADPKTQTVDEEDLWCTPRCLAGSRVCPPEDVGGLGGYAHFLEAWRDPAHPEHKRMRQWGGEHYDPEVFSVQQANSALANLE